jgi:hypothetical protein
MPTKNAVGRNDLGGFSEEQIIAAYRRIEALRQAEEEKKRLAAREAKFAEKGQAGEGAGEYELLSGNGLEPVRAPKFCTKGECPPEPFSEWANTRDTLRVHETCRMPRPDIARGPLSKEEIARKRKEGRWPLQDYVRVRGEQAAVGAVQSYVDENESSRISAEGVIKAGQDRVAQLDAEREGLDQRLRSAQKKFEALLTSLAGSEEQRERLLLEAARDRDTPPPETGPSRRFAPRGPNEAKRFHWNSAAMAMEEIL